MVKLWLVAFVVAGIILGTQANEYLDFNVTEIDRIEELEFGFSKYSSNLNPLMVGLTLIRGADSGAGTFSMLLSLARSLHVSLSFTFVSFFQMSKKYERGYKNGFFCFLHLLSFTSTTFLSVCFLSIVHFQI